MSDWQPTADMVTLQQRAVLLAEIRAFFSTRTVMEVDVPVMAAATVTDPNIESFVVSSPLVTTQQYFLMTSPEFYMKRLLAAGSGAIYYLGHAFRAGDRGSRHQQEFTILEWYRPQWLLPQLIAEVTALVGRFVSGAARQTSYRQAFLDHAGIDPHRAPLSELEALARGKLSPGFDSDDRNIWLDLLFSHLVEPQLHGLVFVTEFPAAQAALAQTITDGYGNSVAQRFELYIDGVEIANGYQEELDATVLEKRFAANLALRKTCRQVLPAVDEAFLAAMRAGMPASAGVALGVDRLLMVASGNTKISAVVPFAC